MKYNLGHDIRCPERISKPVLSDYRLRTVPLYQSVGPFPCLCAYGLQTIERTQGAKEMYSRRKHDEDQVNTDAEYLEAHMPVLFSCCSESCSDSSLRALQRDTVRVANKREHLHEVGS